jgi:sigma-B regulation protein RsbU (phosphoserine phosphatase)
VRKQAERRKAARSVKTELEIASHVQQTLFPHEKRRLATLDYAGRCLPAREVSGDYYDFLDTGDGIGFVLADVSGKGVAAALLMANLQACLRSQPAGKLRHPAEALRTVNRLFHESTPAEHFATMFFGHYDDTNRTMRYVNCGHLAPVLLRADGSLDWLQPTATVVGVFTNWSCEERAVELRPDDTLVLYSDGVTEAGIDHDAEFGENGLLAAIRVNRDAGVDALVDRIVAAVEDQRQDDVTVVALRAR